MTAADALYDALIMAAAKDPEGAGRLPPPALSARADNPLCGDRVTLDVALGPDGRVAAAAHHTRGCLLTRASASLLVRHLRGLAPGDAAPLPAALERALRDADAPWPWPELAPFAPVRPIKSRHECVLLPFRALEGALREAAATPPAPGA